MSTTTTTNPNRKLTGKTLLCGCSEEKLCREHEDKNMKSKPDETTRMERSEVNAAETADLLSGLKPKTSEPLACTECPHIFTEADLAAEDKDAWGHPCHGVKDEPNTVCESFRKPLGEAKKTPPTIKEMSGLVHDFTNGKTMKEYMEELSDGW